MDIAALLAPLDPGRFAREVFGRQPVHIAGGGDKALLDWPGLSALLAVASHWTPDRLTLILNHRPILADFYVDAASGTAAPAMVEQFLSMGASLVANDVERIAPGLRAVTDALGDAFAALVNANVYASFAGIQGFATHYDLHEVFAVQCEGTKVWRIYANRADNPIAPIASGGADAQAAIDAARGPLAMTVTMRQGDVLYLPRGVFHDALAEDGPSLHVTFAVAPVAGAGVLRLLEAAAMRDPAIRAYLPDGRGDPAALTAHLGDLATRLAAIVASDGFRDEVIDAQRARPVRGHKVRLPDPPPLDSFARTARAASVERTAAGAVLVTPGRRAPLGLAFAVAEYALSRPAFSTQELGARFPHVPAAERAALVERLVAEHLVERYTPRV